MRYWHIGRSRNASATVAITAVQLAKSICIESKKKNITSSEMDAPNGKHMAWTESKVCTPELDWVLLAVESCFSSFSVTKTQGWLWVCHQEWEKIVVPRPTIMVLFQSQAPERSVDDQKNTNEEGRDSRTVHDRVSPLIVFWIWSASGRQMRRGTRHQATDVLEDSFPFYHSLGGCHAQHQ